MGFTLIVISWLLRTYGAIQEQRDTLHKPLFWQSDIASLFLIMAWIVLLLAGSYQIYLNSGIIALAVTLVIYFVVAPTLFAPLMKKVLDKIGL